MFMECRRPGCDTRIENTTSVGWSMWDQTSYPCTWNIPNLKQPCVNINPVGTSPEGGLISMVGAHSRGGYGGTQCADE